MRQPGRNFRRRPRGEVILIADTSLLEFLHNLFDYPEFRDINPSEITREKLEDILSEIRIPREIETMTVSQFMSEKAYPPVNVHYISTRLRTNKGYIIFGREVKQTGVPDAIREPEYKFGKVHFFYARTLRGVKEILKRIEENPSNPDTLRLRYSSVINYPP